ncbi:malate dehydrogenase 1 [Megachile rotundata]|uniref:malate dehydrogenase 1 n=1 Tax=Megachile rotundata TaxID=143995 RepID=UPI0006151D2A|nr:PREDICTED: malate dehydrogenase, cytoplasmic [Megachile rotundata]XP_012137708.1 PREDICTED: malate dehydrogenase, cytoplasmic [Megachile rotundata]
MSEPINVAVTGAAGQIAYSLLYQLAAGTVFGPDQPINLRLLDIPVQMKVLEGVVMELEDLALPLLREVTPTADPAVAFKDIAAAFLLGAMPRKQGMERKDLLAANVQIFKVQGEALDKHARKDVKVLVVGNPANTNALICSHYAPSIPKKNFTAMTRLDQNRAQSTLAIRLNVPADKVKNTIIWGNHSSTQYPDASHATVTFQCNPVPVPEAVKDDNWLNTTFIEKIQKRGATVIAARGMSSAMSAAKAAGDHMRDWFFGTKPAQWVSMGVLSDGSYGIPKDLVFSFPVTIENGEFKIVQGLPISDFARKMLNITSKELEEEREEANKVLHSK